MDQIMKQARLMKAALDEGELALINAQALRPLTAEEVFCFRLAACNNRVDRDIERFTEATLEGFASLFVGRPVLLDHKWRHLMITLLLVMFQRKSIVLSHHI